MNRFLLAAALALGLTSAHAQSVQQSGSVTPNTAAIWSGTGIIKGGVSATDSPLTTFGVTRDAAPGICVSSDRSTAAGRNQLCFTASTSGNAQITLQNYGTATAKALEFVVNGTTYAFPGSLTNITVGTTPVIGGTNSNCLFISAGVVGSQACTLSAITSLTGDATATGPGASALTFATVNANTGTFGSGASVPVITVNGKGLITSVSTSPVSVTIGSSTITSGSNQGIIYNNGGLFGNLSTLASSVLITSAGGVPSLATTLPSAITYPTPTFTGTLTFPDAATWTSAGISKAAAISTGSATIPAAGRVNVSDQYQVNGSQIAASNLSNGTTGSGAVVLAAAPAISGTWTGNATFSGNLTLSGNDTFSAQAIHTGTSAPASAAGSTVVMGTIASPTLTNTAQAFLYNTAVNGAILEGDGSTNDVSLFNKSGALVVGVPTGTTKLNFPSLSSGTCASGLGLDAGNNTVLISCPGAASSVQVGTTTITSGSSGNIEFNNAGVLGEVTPGNGIAIVSTTLGLTAARRTLPTSQVLTAASGTYTTPANVLWLEIYMIGGSGGGGGTGTSGAGGGGNGGDTCWNTSGAACTTPVYKAGGGTGGSIGSTTAGANGGQYGAGGTTGGGTSTPTNTSLGGNGGWGSPGVSGVFSGRGGGGGLSSCGAALEAAGGDGGSGITGGGGGGGGGGGACVYTLLNTPAASYTFANGAAGAIGGAGAGGSAGAVGIIGKTVVVEHYGS